MTLQPTPESSVNPYGRNWFLKFCGAIGGATAVTSLAGLGVMGLKNWLFGNHNATGEKSGFGGGNEPHEISNAPAAPDKFSDAGKQISEQIETQRSVLPRVGVCVVNNGEVVGIDADSVFVLQSLTGLVASIVAMNEVIKNEVANPPGKRNIDWFKATFVPFLKEEKGGVEACIQNAADSKGKDAAQKMVDTLKQMEISGFELNKNGNVMGSARAIAKCAALLTNFPKDKRDIIINAMSQRKTPDHSRLDDFLANAQLPSGVIAGQAFGDGSYNPSDARKGILAGTRELHTVIAISDSPGESYQNKRPTFIVVLAQAAKNVTIPIAKTAANRIVGTAMSNVLNAMELDVSPAKKPDLPPPPPQKK